MKEYIQEEFFEERDVTEDIRIFDDKQIVDAAFEYFRETGFPYRTLSKHQCMQEINKLACLSQQSLINTTIAYSVADTYHRHRFHASARNMCSPFESFNDDKKLRRALELHVKYDGDIPDGYFSKLGLVRGTQACSNFRPGFACYMYRRFCDKGDTVLDCSAGYGGRLVGFIASGIKGHYIGIDPNPETQAANFRIAQEFGCNFDTYVLPVEDMELRWVRNECDFSFTSPPYFSKEIYSYDDTQSWVRYKTGKEWRDKFLSPMMQLQVSALKREKFAVVNIADVNIDGEKYPLVAWTKQVAGNVGFELETEEFYGLTRRFGANMKDGRALESILVFRKP